MARQKSLGQLFSAAALEAEIQRLADKVRSRGRVDVLDAEGLATTDLALHQHSVARRLARAIAAGGYQLGPVFPRQARIGDSNRTLYAMGILDAVVVGILARRLSELCELEFPDGLHSYRRGRSSWQAALGFAAYLREHRSARPEPKQRGLYVIRRDVRRYGESIPVGADSSLWTELRAVLHRAGLGDGSGGCQGNDREATGLWTLLQQAVRPEVVQPDGDMRKLDVGVPTGSPIQPVINNLYLVPLDRELESVADGHYARFGDDILFAHPEAEVAARAAERIEAVVQERGLETNPDKRLDLYFTAAGRASDAAAWSGGRGTSSVEYLGYGIHFKGLIALKKRKQRELFGQLKRRWDLSHALLKDLELDSRLSALCQVTNRALDPSCPLAVPMAADVRYVINDRGQLRDLDYRIARELAERLTGIRGVRAFRQVSYQRLRRAGGLHSLVMARNRRGKRKPPFGQMDKTEHSGVPRVQTS